VALAARAVDRSIFSFSVRTHPPARALRPVGRVTRLRFGAPKRIKPPDPPHAQGADTQQGSLHRVTSGRLAGQTMGGSLCPSI
jgi:hypothetical protein